ncbi:alanyl-tRNA editing protein [Vibrio porteresiae]|uniref:Alanyl-tRNA editing protein n=1 Tax=Vibrio porteresiae DSM 19223 TaxID=1123496 RepID=A0ABZ0QAU7_9VIBR|nr:alanyl-tRNA editing protein [Vibrio porteresiae]WPC73525.1 alanyl-tRNA editing protein [Vibrio porteresiae DSM 19223]
MSSQTFIPLVPTQVTFPYSSESLETAIMSIQEGESYTDIVTLSTNFHPVSHLWPDHPADQGSLQIADDVFTVIDCLTGAIDLESGKLEVDKSISVKRDTAGWAFVVVHRIAGSHHGLQLGQAVRLVVDVVHQHALSLAHSAEHLTSLALNQVLANETYWRKDAEMKDSLNHWDFHRYAQSSSQILPLQAVVGYRLGKTLRKRGFNTDVFVTDLDAIEKAVNQQLLAWVDLGNPIDLICDGTTLTESRYWQCRLDDDCVATIPCGGTHARSLSDFASICIIIKQIDNQNIEIHTNVKARSE